MSVFAEVSFDSSRKHEGEETHGGSSSQRTRSSSIPQSPQCRKGEGSRYSCRPPSRRSLRTLRDMPVGERVSCGEGQLRRRRTWRTLRARRMSPRESLRRAWRPSSVRLTLCAKGQRASQGLQSKKTHFSSCATNFKRFSTSAFGKGPNLEAWISWGFERGAKGRTGSECSEIGRRG